jgi:hypothetical protein
MMATKALLLNDVKYLVDIIYSMIVIKKTILTFINNDNH